MGMNRWHRRREQPPLPGWRGGGRHLQLRGDLREMWVAVAGAEAVGDGGLRGGKHSLRPLAGEEEVDGARVALKRRHDGKDVGLGHVAARGGGLARVLEDFGVEGAVHKGHAKAVDGDLPGGAEGKIRVSRGRGREGRRTTPARPR